MADDPARWRRLESVVHAALARPAETRAAFLAEACLGDDELRREAASLLERDARADGFLGTPLDALAARAITSPEATSHVDQPGLVAGSRIGVYEIHEQVGAGGMGVVYRARDTRLHRDVAMKVLLPAVADDPDRLARFAREARVLASLNHPHIAQIHGLEELDGMRALVMELVDGPTLADRIVRGPIPLEEALGIAKQIANALEAAHEQGIIHRDLKPANVKVRPDGTVKVLDFGLAKALEPPAAATGAQSISPPITTPPDTHAGPILGTPAYMSPEQAKGRPADARSDVWAFGVLLFEMLSGRRPFDGANTTELLGAVLQLEPDWRALPALVPPRIRQVIRGCLRKDPRHRLAHFQDVGLALDGAFDTATVAPSDARPAPRSRWPLALVAVVAIAVSVAAGWRLRPSAPERGDVIRFSHFLPDSLTIRNTGHAVFAISPDGRRLVFNTTRGLYVRSMDELEGRLLPGTEEPLNTPFFSPDGQSVGYFQAGQLKRLALAGGAPVVITPASNPFGVTWTADDTILFAQRQGIKRVPAKGGAPELVVPAVDGELLDGPHLLPDGDSLLFSVAAPAAFSMSNRWHSAHVAVQSLRSGARKVLLPNGSDARYVHTGHLVYAVEEGLHAVRFDANALEVRGGAVSIVRGVSRAFGTASANYEVSNEGTLFYVVGAGGAGVSALTWVDREGRAEPIPAIRPRRFSAPRLSPDDERVLVLAEGDVRVYDLKTGRESRVTSDGTVGGFAAWRADGAVAYTSSRSEEAGNTNVWIQLPDVTEKATRLTTLPGQVDVDSWSPDGRTLAVHHHRVPGLSEVLMIPVVDGKSAEPWSFAAERPGAMNAVFSPDGRYVAYVSNETGQQEVYIRPFPGPGAKRPVSVGGARSLTWARNGEVFYQRREDNAIIAQPVATSPRLTVGQPKELFRVAGLLYGVSATTYAVSADGKRLLMIAKELDLAQGGSAARPAVHVVMNWAAELKAKVP